MIADMAGHLAPALTSEQALQRATTPADGLLALLIVDPVNAPRSSAAYVPPREKPQGCGTPRARAVAGGDRHWDLRDHKLREIREALRSTAKRPHLAATSALRECCIPPPTALVQRSADS